MAVCPVTDCCYSAITRDMWAHLILGCYVGIYPWSPPKPYLLVVPEKLSVTKSGV